MACRHFSMWCYASCNPCLSSEVTERALCLISNTLIYGPHAVSLPQSLFLCSAVSQKNYHNKEKIDETPSMRNIFYVQRGNAVAILGCVCPS